jgi:hypothetical protein
VICERSGKGEEESRCRTFETLSGICWTGEETKLNLSQVSWCYGQNSSRVPPECKSEALPLETPSSVTRIPDSTS